MNKKRFKPLATVSAVAFAGGLMFGGAEALHDYGHDRILSHQAEVCDNKLNGSPEKINDSGKCPGISNLFTVIKEPANTVPGVYKAPTQLLFEFEQSSFHKHRMQQQLPDSLEFGLTGFGSIEVSALAIASVIVTRRRFVY